MRYALATLVAGVWINLSEFLRNELLFKQFWSDKYNSLGLSFPSAPINGLMWGVWGFLFAACIVALSRKLTFVETLVVSWTIGFLLMWIVVWNLNVLPLGLFPIAAPWSLVEVAGAVVFARWIVGKQKAEPESGHVRK